MVQRKQCSWIGLPLLLFCQLAASCGWADEMTIQPEVVTRSKTLVTRVVFVDSRYQEIPAARLEAHYAGSKQGFPDPLALLLGVVEGTTMGAVSDRFKRIWLTRRDKGAVQNDSFWTSPTPFSRVLSGDMQRFELDLDRIERELARAARPAEKMSWGIAVDPPAARISRLATGAHRSMDSATSFLSPGLGEVGFIDQSTGNRLMLVYSDRPCGLTGAIYGRERGVGHAYWHAAVLDRQGLHWLAITPTEVGTPGVGDDGAPGYLKRMQEQEEAFLVAPVEPPLSDIAVYIRPFGME